MVSVSGQFCFMNIDLATAIKIIFVAALLDTVNVIQAALSQTNQIVPAEYFGLILDAVNVAFSSARGGDTGGLGSTGSGLRYEGFAAGDGFEYPWAMWASYQRVGAEDNFAASALDADTNVFMVGADFSPWDNVLTGVSFGYESSDIDTIFNAGDVDIDGFTVAPYLAADVSDWVGTDFNLQVDFAVGFSRLDVSSTAAGVTADTDSDRYFFASNLTAGQQFGDLYVSGGGGIVVARDETDTVELSIGGTAPGTRSEFGRLSFGGEAAYIMDSFEPFVSAAYEHDFERESPVAGHPNDKNAFRVGGGLRYFGDSGVSGSVEYNTVVGRNKADEDTLSLLIRGEF